MPEEKNTEKPGQDKVDETLSTVAAVTGDIQMLKDIPLEVRIELGRSRMYLADVLKLKVGSLVELDKLAGDPVDIVVNDKPVARGEVLVLNDNFCVRITDVFNSEERTRRT